MCSTRILVAPSAGSFTGSHFHSFSKCCVNFKRQDIKQTNIYESNIYDSDDEYLFIGAITSDETLNLRKMTTNGP